MKTFSEQGTVKIMKISKYLMKLQVSRLLQKSNNLTQH